MQHQLICKACGRPFGTVEAATNLEIPCPWCYETTVFNTHRDKLTSTLLRGKSPEQLTGSRKREAFDRMMRGNRYIDAHKC